jgi:hypothetical protein
MPSYDAPMELQVVASDGPFCRPLRVTAIYPNQQTAEDHPECAVYQPA